MEFDPLSFFEPEKKNLANDYSNEDATSLSVTETRSLEKQVEKFTKEIDGEHEAPISENVDNILQLQVLDLPPVRSDLSASILLTLLRLFQPNQTKNFGNVSKVVCKPNGLNGEEFEQYLNSKSITINELKELSKFLNSSIGSTLTLAELPKEDHSGITSYLTKIVSFPFPGYTEEQRDFIYDLASHVMTANSAPALKGDTTRVVEIEGFKKDILLYEPALTEDKIGNITWGASLELGKQIVSSDTTTWLPKDPSKFSVPILELGAGTGLVTIVLAELGYSVVSTDLPEIIDNLEKNIKLNQLECTRSSPEEKFTIESSVHVTSLDWRSPDEFLDRTSSLDGYETVLLSDPVYSPAHPFWVRDAVFAVLSKSKSARVVFMVGQRDRFQDVRDCLWKLMSDIGLELKESRIVDGFDDYGTLQYDYKVFGWKSGR